MVCAISILNNQTVFLKMLSGENLEFKKQKYFINIAGSFRVVPIDRNKHG